MSAFCIREAAPQDCAVILTFIKELAEYESLADEVVATEEDLRRTLFDLRQAEVLLAEEDGRPVGFALFFSNYSTFLGKANLYLEDLYVRQECRGKGYGNALLRRLAQAAVERGCGRLDWACLDWNTPSIEFYKSMGAVPLDNWMVFRLQGEALQKLGAR